MEYWEHPNLPIELIKNDAHLRRLQAEMERKDLVPREFDSLYGRIKARIQEIVSMQRQRGNLRNQ